MRTLVTALALALAVAHTAHAQTACSDTQTQRQIDARIDALIAKMTVSERVAQLGDRAPAIARLGLPAYNWWNEGLHGIARNGYATVFPQAIGLAATWDTALLRSVGDTVSTEARAKYNPHRTQDSPRYGGLTVWSPNINIFRDPRWGRGQETYGEDPYLTASLGTQFVKGVQGGSPFYLKADATPKHFVAHSGPEEGRDSFHANAGAHDLADTYLPAFHALITQGGAAALMCSYNAVGPTPSCANGLLQQRVRDVWHFQGYVVSDCDAVGNLTEYHHYTADAAHGAAAALNAGTDLDCGSSYNALNDAFAQHLVTGQTIDRSLHRLLLARLRLGMLDDAACSPYNKIAPAENDTPAHRALALRAADESVVLLKNDGVLPLDPARRVAVIGPTADMLKVLEANYHGTASDPVTPLNGLEAGFRNVVYAQGSVLAAGTSVPVPRTALRVSAAPDARPGLTAEYFTNTAFSGTPAVSVTVATVDLDLNHAGPAPQIPPTTYSARWSGVFAPPAPGDYLLRVHVRSCWHCPAQDNIRLFLDGKAVIDNEGADPTPDHVTFHTVDTAPHSIRLELVNLRESKEDDDNIALEWEPPAAALLDEAADTAAKADVIVACVGLSPDLEGEALKLKIDGFNGGDRTSLDLPAAQRALLTRLKRLNKPMIVVLTSGSAVALDGAPYNALLTNWYPGEAGGIALADVLTGKYSPSGRLPVTFYRSVADLPDFSDYSMDHRTYRYFTGPVLYPFGFGLSYTRFSYGPARLSAKTVAAGQPLTATAVLRNTGKLAADEVAELYLVPPQVPGSPHLTLQGVQRVRLDPGDARTLTFTLTPTQLSFVDPAGHRAVRPGAYRIFIGGAQPTPAELADPAAGATFTVTGEKPFDF
jgi:beta-glucosidase